LKETLDFEIYLSMCIRGHIVYQINITYQHVLAALRPIPCPFNPWIQEALFWKIQLLIKITLEIIGAKM
jgi:hypothetical protein